MSSKMFKYKKPSFLTVLSGLAVILTLLLNAFPGCGVQITTKPTPAGPLTIKALDIGQGDAVLIRTPKETVLIDTGDISAKDKLVAHLVKENITSLDKVIITHPHADHLGGMPKVLEKFKVKQIYDSGQSTTSNLYSQYLNTVSKKKIPFKVVTDGEIIDLGDDIYLKILSPQKTMITGTESDLNNNSIIARLVFKDFSMMLAGDAEKESEDYLVKKYGKALKSTVLKSPHHGSRTSSTLPFLQATNPEAVIISLAADNSYGHPHSNILKRYQDRKIKIYRTDTDGTITVTSDGKSYTIQRGR